MDKAGLLEQMRFLQHCFKIQESRVCHFLSLEKSQRKLFPNGWREIAELIDIYEKIQRLKADAQRAGLEISDGTVPLEERHSSIGAISNLDPIDRGLLREAGEESLRIRQQLLKEDENGQERNREEK